MRKTILAAAALAFSGAALAEPPARIAEQGPLAQQQLKAPLFKQAQGPGARVLDVAPGEAIRPAAQGERQRPALQGERPRLSQEQTPFARRDSRR